MLEMAVVIHVNVQLVLQNQVRIVLTSMNVLLVMEDVQIIVMILMGRFIALVLLDIIFPERFVTTQMNALPLHMVVITIAATLKAHIIAIVLAVMSCIPMVRHVMTSMNAHRTQIIVRKIA